MDRLTHEAAKQTAVIRSTPAPPRPRKPTAIWPAMATPTSLAEAPTDSLFIGTALHPPLHRRIIRVRLAGADWAATREYPFSL